MAVTIPLVLVFAGLLALILRLSRTGYGTAIVAALFGFFLAATGAGGPVTDFIRHAINAIPEL
ncbi:hypothetical protein ACFYVL_16460 [Streptomyces sp. NPDC004111]|uniref:hypothetical protein n=1 Tax=Streptomyces sp. NPDC004111 TaxID=3364690 RepID=UPI0036B873D8